MATERASGTAARIGSSLVSYVQTIEYLVDHRLAPRARSIAHCSRVGTRLLVASGLLDQVERLELGAVEEPTRLLSATPRLRALRVRGALDGYAAAIPPTVVELVWHESGGLAAVAALAIAPTLERLRLDARELTWDLEAFAAFPALRSLDLSWAKLAPNYEPFAMERPNVLPSLRELSLPRWIDEKSVETVARTMGSQLDTLHWSGRLPRDSRAGSPPWRGTCEMPSASIARPTRPTSRASSSSARYRPGRGARSNSATATGPGSSAAASRCAELD